MEPKLKSIFIVGVALSTSFTGIARSETLLYPISGYTSTSSGRIESFTTLIFDDEGRVVATGGDELLAGHADATRIDGRNEFVLPGLIDAHGHVSRLGFLNEQLNLTGLPSVEDALERISAYDMSHPGPGWIEGFGWNQVLWPTRNFPTAAQLDAVVPDRPVLLERIDGHAYWVNGKALEIAGVDDDTPDPVGGRIHRDSSGHATGILVDNAMNLIADKRPQPSVQDYRNAIRSALRQLASLGLTGVHDAGIDIRQVEAYLSLADDHEMTIRVYAMLSGAGENLDAVARPVQAYGNDRLTIAAVKLYADGALGSRGAAMIEPYQDDPGNRGLLFWTQSELEGFIRKSNHMGFQVCIHAIGDLANKQALDAFERVQGGAPSAFRNRIEHAQVVRLGDIPRFKDLGIVASMQGTHATSDMNMAEHRIGPERIKGAYAWRKFLDVGAIIANGSDFPIELPNPMHGLYASVTRKNRDGLPDSGWYPAESMSRAEALHSFTWAAAYAAHQEDRVGSLEPGKWADFIVVDRDYFKIPESEIDDIQVIQTWIGGELIFDRCTSKESNNDC